MIRRRIATALIALALLLGLGHALTPGVGAATPGARTNGEIEWCPECIAP